MSYRELVAPLSCQIELTTVCNQTCVHCYNHWRGTGCTDTSLTNDKISYIIEELARAQVFELLFTGGEPLTNFDVLMTGIAKAATHGMKTGLNSNLGPLSERRARLLRQSGIRSILTSLMGPDAETHDAIAQRTGAFARLLRNIDIAQKNGIAVAVNMVVTQKNYTQVLATAKLTRSLRISTFNATKAGCPGNCRAFSHLSLTRSQFEDYLTQLVQARDQLGLKVDFLEGYPVCAIADKPALVSLLGRRCLAGVSTCTIASNGDVRPCSHLDIAYGNIFSDGLLDSWKRMSDWRKSAYLPAECGVCTLRNVCGGGCRMEAKMNSGGNLNALDPFARPDSVQNCAETIDAVKATTTHESNRLSAVFAFLPLSSLIRFEEFGAVVYVPENRSRFLLNQAGLRVYKQLSANELYTSNDPRVDWQTVDSQAFCRSLIRRGGAKLHS